MTAGGGTVRAPRRRVPWLLGSLLPGGAAATILHRNVRVARHAAVFFAAAVVEPVVYLLATDGGLSGVVGAVETAAGPVAYGAYVAPALLATAALYAAIAESTFNLYSKLRVEKIYSAALTTPAEPRDVILGELAWVGLRGTANAVVFLGVAAAFGVVRSWWAVLAVPAALLLSVAVAAVGSWLTTFMRSWQDFDFITLAVYPMFLFSATFFPLDVYPPSARVLAQVSPLYHAVEVMRAAMLGTADVSLIGHVAVLVALVGVGLTLAPRRIDRLLRG